jgi:hypothetical protein
MNLVTDKQTSRMRWISFIIACVAFLATVFNCTILGKEIDKTITGVFLTVSAFAWGASTLGILKNTFKK